MIKKNSKGVKIGVKYIWCFRIRIHIRNANDVIVGTQVDWSRVNVRANLTLEKK